MWSATWPKEVRKLAEDFLINYMQVCCLLSFLLHLYLCLLFLQINIGSVSLAANHNITQIVDVCDESEKYTKLYKLLTDVNANLRENKTIIFAETKRKVDELSNQMKAVGWLVNSIHGDKPQSERDWVLNGKSTTFYFILHQLPLSQLCILYRWKFSYCKREIERRLVCKRDFPINDFSPRLRL